MSTTIGTYETERVAIARDPDHVTTRDDTLISWDDSATKALVSGEQRILNPAAIRTATYRPFFKQHMYFSREWNPRPGRMPNLFPSSEVENSALVVIAPRSEALPTTIVVGTIPDLSFFTYTAQCFCRWRFEAASSEGRLDLGDGEVIGDHRRLDNVTDFILGRFRDAYGDSITKDYIFYYVYGLLHSPEYRKTYAADLKKMLPRIPLVVDPWPFVEAGRTLCEVHLGYEAAAPYQLAGLDVVPAGDPYEFFRVEKMAFAKVPGKGKKVADKSTIRYNSKVTVSGIPDEAHRYMLGSRSAVEWVIDRYQVKTDKASGIINDPNDWSREVDDPRYILDLLARVVTVSVETTRIVEALPGLDVIVAP